MGGSDLAVRPRRKEEQMSEKVVVDLGNVQKTLFLPLWGRACETKKIDPLLVDKTALEIIEKVDFDFSTITRNISELSQIAWIMRSICVDGVIARMLEKYPKATIVNIGCGLDTTFDRIDNGHLFWYDLDLPDVIELRKRFIKENDRRKTLSTSFLEESWLKEITVGDNVLFIAAGVFYYFRLFGISHGRATYGGTPARRIGDSLQGQGKCVGIEL